MKQSGDGQGVFRVLCDNYVTSDSGTGIVHQAPGFSEVSNDVIVDHVRSHEHIHDDFRVCTHYGIIKRDEKVVCPMDETGCFTSKVTDFKGKYVKVMITVALR